MPRGQQQSIDRKIIKQFDRRAFAVRFKQVGDNAVGIPKLKLDLFITDRSIKGDRHEPRGRILGKQSGIDRRDAGRLFKVVKRNGRIINGTVRRGPADADHFIDLDHLAIEPPLADGVDLALSCQVE